MIEEHAEAEAIPQHTDVLVRSLKWVIGFFCVLLIVVSITLVMLMRPPLTFPVHSTIEVTQGQSVAGIVAQFAEEGYVRSSDVLYAVLLLEYDASDIRAGIYTFEEPVGTREVAHIITKIGPSEPLISVTFPEGSTVAAIAETADAKLPAFNKDSFLSYAREFEGSLFPETYFVPDTFTQEQLFDLLRNTYEEKVSPLREQIAKHPLTEAEVLVLASIIEREANTAESMKLVSGVLQNRLAIDMPLQADASIEYVLDKPLSELVPEDLQIDSPYNTYLNRGLPPTPIGNPGLDSIMAVLEPTESDYFYYITDTEGVFHFAQTLDEHNTNIARYLR